MKKKLYHEPIEESLTTTFYYEDFVQNCIAKLYYETLLPDFFVQGMFRTVELFFSKCCFPTIRQETSDRSLLQ